MAVDTFSNRSLMEDIDDDDDEAPLVFKRSSTSSRKNQSNSESTKLSSQKPDGQTAGQASNARSESNSGYSKLSSQKLDGQTPRQNSNVHSAYGGTTSGSNGKNFPSARASSTSSSKVPLSRFPGAMANRGKDLNQGTPKAIVKQENLSAEPSIRAKTVVKQEKLYAEPYMKTNTAVKQEKLSAEPSTKAHDDSDSEDEVPLSTRLKNRSDISTKVPQGSSFAKRDTTVASSSKCIDSDDEKPLARRVQQNGFSEAKKSPVGVNKRPSSDSRSSVQSSIKKPKLSDASTSYNNTKVPVKPEPKSKEDGDHIPLSQRFKQSSSSTKSSVGKGAFSSVKKVDKNSKKIQKTSKYEPSTSGAKKWNSLVHNGVIFPPPYQPHGVKILYKNTPVHLTPEQEEVATMYAVMLETEYVKKDAFNKNFFNDWKKILGKDHVIQNLEDCDFNPIFDWHQAEKEKKKQMSSEEKKAIREEKMKQEEKYMWAIVDGVKEKVGNFRVEPPGLFRGRGEHPKMGKLKKRIRPSDITINIGKGEPIPECPVPGERWKEVKHDNTVTWLAFWNDPINSREMKYVFLAASSTLKGQSDKEKYEKARKLIDHIDKIRETYTKNFASKDATKRQIAVATYLIDKLALRAGNEKDDDEADTVGCCTLKVENVEPIPPNTLKFDFLGKDSIKYYNEVEVELPVFEAIQKFRRGKKDGDDLFDMLDTSKLNAHLKELMPGLTAKVFRTYNASRTLDDLLTAETNGEDVAENIVIYQRANKEVAIICNHQRTVSKSHGSQMERLDEKIKELNNLLEELRVDLDRAKRGKPPLKGADGKTKRNLAPEAIEKKMAQIHARIEKMERDKTTKEDLKTVALGTSKTNYLDPRITVAWCKRHDVPIEKMFNKSLLAKFSWAMDVEPSFRF